MTNALALVKKGLLWAVCCGVLSGGGAFAGNTGVDNGVDALKSTSSVAQRVLSIPTFNHKKIGVQADLKVVASEKNVATFSSFRA